MHIKEKKENYIRLDQQRERDFQMNELNKLKHKIKTFRNKKHDQSTWAFEENFAQPLNLPEKFDRSGKILNIVFDQKWLSTLFDANVIHQFTRETRQPIKMRQVIGAVIGRYFWFPPPSKISPREDFNFAFCCYTKQRA